MRATCPHTSAVGFTNKESETPRESFVITMPGAKEPEDPWLLFASHCENPESSRGKYLCESVAAFLPPRQRVSVFLRQCPPTPAAETATPWGFARWATPSQAHRAACPGEAREAKPDGARFQRAGGGGSSAHGVLEV
jgi:hypothetical protein